LAFGFGARLAVFAELLVFGFAARLADFAELLVFGFAVRLADFAGARPLFFLVFRLVPEDPTRFHSLPRMDGNAFAAATRRKPDLHTT